MEIQRTKKTKPPRVLIFGEHKIGKSSLSAAAPNPVFIQTEDGLDEIDTEAYQLATTFDMLNTQLMHVYQSKHEYQTLIIDSLDWTEKLINEHVCIAGGKDSISDFGYGAGFQIAYETFVKVKNALDIIRKERNMAIILIAHSQIKEYQSPTSANYDRHSIKLRDKNAELWLEWCDIIGFLHTDIFVKEKKDGFSTVTKASGGTDRVLSCYPSAPWVAGNRYGITDDIAIPDPATGWDNLIKAIKGESK